MQHRVSNTSTRSLHLNLPIKTQTLGGNKASNYANNPVPSPLASNAVFLFREIGPASSVHDLFDKMPELDVVSATTIVGRFFRQRQYKKAVHSFSRMLFLGIRPSEFTFGTVVPVSTALRDLELGKQFHACAIKMGLHSTVFVGSVFLDVYSKLSFIQEAQKAFEDIYQPNVVSYTSLIHGYLKQKMTEDALRLFKMMPERNVVSWNAMIAGYSQMGNNEEAVNLFIEMLREGLVPDQSTFPCVFVAVANIAALGMGKSLHACVLKFLGYNINVFVGNSIVSFYAKCGSMDDSLLVFDTLPERNVVSWNSLICGFAQNGRGEDAVKFFEKMKEIGLRPNGVTLLGLLWACTHAGLIDKGYSHFNQARLENPSILGPEHYACMVDLLARGGRFREAHEFLHNLPFDPGIGFWKALLGGCQIHSNMELAELAAQKILALDPEDVSSYVMLSNVYSAAGKWQNVSTIRREMRERGMKRVPGCSWIENKSQIDVFVNSDRNHHQKHVIYSALNDLYWHLQDTENLQSLSDY